jgi:hypothetical protein
VIAGMEGTLPIEPWHIGGPVVKGFGRGSKVLGIPTGMYLPMCSLYVLCLKLCLLNNIISFLGIYFTTYLTLVSHFVSMNLSIKMGYPCSL